MVAPDALPEGQVAPTGATAPVSAKPTGVSPDPYPHLGAPEPATKPTSTQRQHGQEAPTPSHHDTAK